MRNVQQRGRRRILEAGFTLLEVVVAMVLVGILASAMTSVTIGTMRGVAGNRVHEQAVRIAERTMEQMRAMAFATVERTTFGS